MVFGRKWFFHEILFFKFWLIYVLSPRHIIGVVTRPPGFLTGKIEPI